MEKRYQPYKLSRVVSIYEILSADYLAGIFRSFLAHSHQDAWELCYCTDGEVVLFRDDDQTSLHGGQCALVAPGVVHNIRPIQPHGSCFVVCFTCEDSYLRMLQDQVLQTDSRQADLFHKIMEELQAAFETEKARLRLKQFQPNAASPVGAEQLICCYLEEVLIELLRAVTRRADAQHADLETAVQSYLADQVAAFIQDHLDEDLSVDRIAAHFHYSRTRLSLLYKTASGVALGRAVTQARIARAKELLAAGEKSVTEIAAELGYSSPQYFSRKFAQEVGCPPSQYTAQV